MEVESVIHARNAIKGLKASRSARRIHDDGRNSQHSKVLISRRPARAATVTSNNDSDVIVIESDYKGQYNNRPSF